MRSGKDVDKFKELHLTPEKAEYVSAPLIAESPVNIECKVVKKETPGSHHIFLAEVKAVHVDDAYMDQKGRFALEKTDPIVYVHGQYYSLGKLLGTFGYSVKKPTKKNGWNILEQQTGAFTQAKSHEVMEEYLKKYKDIDMVYCENDSEALGAINAIEQAGKKVGTDGIQIISFDATREGLARSTKRKDCRRRRNVIRILERRSKR